MIRHFVCAFSSVLVVVALGRIATQTRPAPIGTPPAGIHFTDITETAGLRFQHVSGGSGRYYYIEQWGSGAAFFDDDGDGWPDVFLAQGGALPGYKAPVPAGNRLFRNKRLPTGAGALNPGSAPPCARKTSSQPSPS